MLLGSYSSTLTLKVTRFFFEICKFYRIRDHEECSRPASMVQKIFIVMSVSTDLSFDSGYDAPTRQFISGYLRVASKRLTHQMSAFVTIFNL